MPDEKTTKQKPEGEKLDPAKQAKADSFTPDQKHARYLADLERLHEEP